MSNLLTLADYKDAEGITSPKEDLRINSLIPSVSQYYLDSRTDSIIRTNESGTRLNWKHGVGAVEVIYKAGYASLPSDLKLAVIDLITYYLKDEHKERRTLGAASITNTASTSQRDNVAFPDHIKRVLDLYKNF